MRLALGLTIQLRAVAAATAALLTGGFVLSVTGNPSYLHYRRLTANHKHYWMAGSDAIKFSRPLRTGLAVLKPRGDECLNCEGGVGRSDGQK